VNDKRLKVNVDKTAIMIRGKTAELLQITDRKVWLTLTRGIYNLKERQRREREQYYYNMTILG